MPTAKTLHDPGKRPNRFWLYAPYVVVLILSVLLIAFVPEITLIVPRLLEAH